jgi:hypothetical protein
VIRKKDIRLFVLIVVAFFVVVLVFQFIFSKLIYKHEEVEQCKVFAMNSTNIQDFFGTIESIELRVKGGGRSVSTEEGISGSCSFRIKGTEQKGNIKVEWRKNDGKINITRISMREGLAGTRILWPQAKATSVGYILPSHVWDGIISLVGAPLIFFFYLNSKRNGRLVRFFFPFINRSESSQVIMQLFFLVAAFGSMLLSILCFLNIYTLF